MARVNMSLRIDVELKMLLWPLQKAWTVMALS